MHLIATFEFFVECRVISTHSIRFDSIRGRAQPSSDYLPIPKYKINNLVITSSPTTGAITAAAAAAAAAAAVAA